MSEPAPVAPAPVAPSATSRFVAALSRAELAILGGGALLLLVDFLSWFGVLTGYAHAIVAFAALATVLVLLRNSLPAAVAAAYPALLFVSALAVAVMGARSVILFALEILQPPVGASPAYLLNFVAVVAGTAAVAYGVYLLWKGRGA
jgi:hypothetical protein